MGINQRRRRRTVRHLIVIFLIALAIVALILYGRSVDERNSFLFVKFRNPDGSVSAAYKLAIAKTVAERAKGLMFVKEMPRQEGMVFIYPQAAANSFWMKNTFIPLDMIFIDPDWKVIGVLHDVPPNNTVSRRVEGLSQFVIELNAGEAAKAGVVANSKVEFEGSPPIASE